MKTNYRFRSICIFSLLALLTMCATAQERKSAERAKTSERKAAVKPNRAIPATQESQDVDLSVFKLKSQEIKRIQPRIPEQVLEQDVALITSSLPHILSEFAKVGIAEEDAVWATARAWESARLESPLKNNPEQMMNQESFVAHVTNDFGSKILKWQIRNENPDIPSAVLVKDLRVIENSLPEISAEFEKLGWDSSDARLASLAAWKTVRLDSELKPTQTMNQASFVLFVGSDLGSVVFRSVPDEADVFQGEKKLGTTNKEKQKALLRYFKDGQKVTVRFIKPQFVSTDKECVAKKRAMVECVAELKPDQ